MGREKPKRKVESLNLFYCRHWRAIARFKNSMSVDSITVESITVPCMSLKLGADWAGY